MLIIHSKKDKRDLRGPRWHSCPTHCSGLASPHVLTVLQVTPPPSSPAAGPKPPSLGSSSAGAGAGSHPGRTRDSQPRERMQTATPSGHILQAEGLTLGHGATGASGPPPHGGAGNGLGWAALWVWEGWTSPCRPRSRQQPGDRRRPFPGGLGPDDSRKANVCLIAGNTLQRGSGQGFYEFHSQTSSTD